MFKLHLSNTRFCLLCGPDQVWDAVDPEDEVLAMVCRTGLNTQMGNMVRQLASPSQLAQQEDPFIKVSPMSFLLKTCPRAFPHPHILTERPNLALQKEPFI